MKKHFVTFQSPGTFVHEETTRPIESWDVQLAQQMARDVTERYGATPFCFFFTTRHRGNDELDSKEIRRSGRYFLGGTVETYEQVKARATENDSILLSNMECNNIKRIVTNDNSWRAVQPLEEDDIVLEWTK